MGRGKTRSSRVLPKPINISCAGGRWFSEKRVKKERVFPLPILQGAAHPFSPTKARKNRSTRSPGIVRRGRLRQWRRGLGRHPVARCLLIRIGELEQYRLAIGPAKKRYADRQVVDGKSGRHCHRSRVDEECIPARHSLGAGI